MTLLLDLHEPAPLLQEAAQGVRDVAALCIAPNSIYKTMPGVVAYDKARDVRSFAGGMPVLAHPPCRSWSAYTAHQAKPEPGEKELGLLCAEWLRSEGGVLEHPAHSRLFEVARLPMPGQRLGDLYTMLVWQAWWGYPMRKATWLLGGGVLADLENCIAELQESPIGKQFPVLDIDLLFGALCAAIVRRAAR